MTHAARLCLPWLERIIPSNNHFLEKEKRTGSNLKNQHIHWYFQGISCCNLERSSKHRATLTETAAGQLAALLFPQALAPGQHLNGKVEFLTRDAKLAIFTPVVFALARFWYWDYMATRLATLVDFWRQQTPYGRNLGSLNELAGISTDTGAIKSHR